MKALLRSRRSVRSPRNNNCKFVIASSPRGLASGNQDGKTPRPKWPGRFVQRVPDNDLLSHGNSVLSSACRRFTVLFGMGRGGSSGLWSSGIDGWPHAWRAAAFGGSKAQVRLAQTPSPVSTHGYGVKPHGQLVPVSSRHYCPYTPGLSTS